MNEVAIKSALSNETEIKSASSLELAKFVLSAGRGRLIQDGMESMLDGLDGYLKTMPDADRSELIEMLADEYKVCEDEDRKKEIETEVNGLLIGRAH